MIRVTDASPSAKVLRRPRFQFSLLGLMVLMLAMSLFGAPLYYFLRGNEGQPHMHLVGMIGLLAGPMLLTIAASLVVALAQWLGRR
ncbi:MAG: hypothetical protein WD872_08015 [Pirellulaceae bacterium]